MNDSEYLSARVLQILGLILLAAAFAYWGMTGNQSELFVGAAMSLIGLGSYQGFRVTLNVRRDNETSDPGGPARRDGGEAE